MIGTKEKMGFVRANKKSLDAEFSEGAQGPLFGEGAGSLALGNEADDFRFLQHLDQKREVTDSNTVFTELKNRRKVNQRVHEYMGHPNSAIGLIVGIDIYQKSDFKDEPKRYSWISNGIHKVRNEGWHTFPRRNSPDDTRYIAFRIQILHNQEIIVEFTQRMTGNSAYNTLAWLKSRWGLKDYSCAVPVYWNRVKSEWRIDPRKKPAVFR